MSRFYFAYGSNMTPERVTEPDQVIPDLPALLTSHSDRLTEFRRSLDVFPHGLATQTGRTGCLFEGVALRQPVQDAAVFPTPIHGDSLPETRLLVHRELAVTPMN